MTIWLMILATAVVLMGLVIATDSPGDGAILVMIGVVTALFTTGVW